jgi:acyl dehydratase
VQPAKRHDAELAVIDFYEEMAIGQKTVLGSHTFSLAEIKSYASRYDPQPFHVDEAAAARTHFGGLCASGWHTATLWMRLMVSYQRRRAEERRARGEPVAQLGPSPGFRELRWLRPVRPGDTVTYAAEIIEMRESNSRRGWGLITLRNTGTNQAGEPVLSWISTAFVQRRSAE